MHTQNDNKKNLILAYFGIFGMHVVLHLYAYTWMLKWILIALNSTNQNTSKFLFILQYMGLKNFYMLKLKKQKQFWNRYSKRCPKTTTSHIHFINWQNQDGTQHANQFTTCFEGFKHRKWQAVLLQYPIVMAENLKTLKVIKIVSE